MRRSIHTVSQTAPSIYSGSTDAIMQQPQPDPGETYPHVNTQLFGVIDPASNADLTNGPIAAARMSATLTPVRSFPTVQCTSTG